MKIFNFFRRKNRSVGGFIGAYGLDDWWLFELTSEERLILAEKYQPMGFPSNPIVGMNISVGDMDDSKKAYWLSQLAGWLRNKDNVDLCIKILIKSQTYSVKGLPVIDQHFYFYALMNSFYRLRNYNPTALAHAEKAARSMIAIQREVAQEFMADPGMGFLPSHPGYTQLAIILEKRKNYSEALSLCQEAVQNGWAYKSDWPKRIARLQTKIEKSELQ